jgi:hypothetical protein
MPHPSPPDEAFKRLVRVPPDIRARYLLKAAAPFAAGPQILRLDGVKSRDRIEAYADATECIDFSNSTPVK